MTALVLFSVLAYMAIALGVTLQEREYMPNDTGGTIAALIIGALWPLTLLVRFGAWLASL